MPSIIRVWVFPQFDRMQHYCIFPEASPWLDFWIKQNHFWVRFFMRQRRYLLSSTKFLIIYSMYSARDLLSPRQPGSSPVREFPKQKDSERLSPQPPGNPESPSDWKVIKDPLRRLYARYRTVFLIGLNIFIAVAAILVYDALSPKPPRLTQQDIDAAVGRALETAPLKPSFASTAYEAIRPSLVAVSSEDSDSRASGAHSSLATGVVIIDNGTILTALHAVQGASRVRVLFSDGSQSDALVIGRQPEKDLAILQALQVPDDLKPATLASSASLSVGDEVVAVGNPFGILDSVSAGVVSGLGREFTLKEMDITLKNLIQFDAAVNPGNSGGPLLNRDGEVVGIVTALLNPTDQQVFIGIGFAVPIEFAMGGFGIPPT
ncbi:MAG: trypsin-like peptidase domain-containing protein [Spirochaetota bacterium]